MTNDLFAGLRADWEPDLRSALRGLYGERADDVADRLMAAAGDASRRRSEDLRSRDLDRLARPDWYQSPERLGYMAYVDRFGGDLRGVAKRIPYLTELGVDVLHLLALLAAREGEDDGGFALRDYRRPDPRHGTPADLDELIAALHEADISLCVDFVLNHTSDDHEWAMAAKDGSDYHRRLFFTFPDRTEPDAYEATLPEIFPDIAPGNFTWVPEVGGWVWTTFNEFQWDLDWSNPDVMIEVAALMFDLANLGVDILRLDAIAFTWKRLGTNCQNQPEAHLIAQALRAALAMAAPATILLAEAIVGPDDLVGYLGRHELERRECELAYHNQLMVQSWGMLAARRADLGSVALQRLPTPPARTTWFTYVRCHDDIGWAVDDADAAAVDLAGAAHREFLAAYFRGDFPGSFGRGTPFGRNPVTNDERTSGMAAALAGVTAGVESDDPQAIDLGVRRMLLLYAIAFGFGGIPIVYMGDELCQLDDVAYLHDPHLADDSRWCHRPRFDDALAAERSDAATLAGRLWAGIGHLAAVRRDCPQLHGGTPSRPFDAGHRAVFAWRRSHPRFGDLVGLANVDDTAVDAMLPTALAPVGPIVDRLDPTDANPTRLDPLQVRWLTTADGYATVPSPR